MVLDLFSAILKELAQAMDIPDLQPDQNQSCLIRFPDGGKVQLELDKTANFLIVGSVIGEVPPGRYRESLFREALRANGMSFPRFGDFAYSRKSNTLVLSQMLPLKDLNGEKVFAFLTPFLEKSRLWTEALSKGDVPVLQSQSTGGKGIGIFGLRP